MMVRFKIFSDFERQINAGMTTRQTPEGSFQNDSFLNQVHGDTIHWINDRPKKELTSDALITQTPDLPLMVKVADCQGVLIFDPPTCTIAAVHSGWRGSVQNIIGKTIQKMAQAGCDPANLRVAVSPSLGLCCAEFTDPAHELPALFQPFIHGKKVDFWAITQAQCVSAGISEKHLEITRDCTRCHPERYYSHRRKDPERMGVFIALKPPS